MENTPKFQVSRLRNYKLDGTNDITILFSVKNEGKELRANLKCNRDKEETTYSTTDKDLVIMNVIGKVGCPFLSITYFYEKYPFIFAIVFIGTGILITFFGLKLFRVLLFILAAFALTAVLLVIIYQLILLPRRQEAIAFWITLGISGLFGLTAGYFAARYYSICFMLAGGALAAMLAFFLWNVIQAPIHEAVSLTF